MPTIEQLAYKIVANTEGFTDGVVATRAELRAARQITEATMSTYEKLERSLEGVTHLYEIGAIDVQAYNRAMAELRQKADQTAAANNRVADSARNASVSVNASAGAHSQLLQAQLANVPVIGRVSSALQGVPPQLWAIVAGVAATKIGFDLLSAGLATIQERTGAIMNLDRQAEALGLRANALSGWRDAASDLSGAVDGELDAALSKMNMRIAEAAHGSGGAAKAMAALGLDAKSLAEGGTEEAFYRIVDALAQVENQGERARLTVDIFGKSGAGLINTFSAGSESLREAVSDAERIGLALSNLDTARIVAMGHAWDDVMDVSEGFANKLTARVAPGLTAVANTFTAALEEGQPLNEIMNALIDAGGALADNLGYVMDVGATFLGPATVAAATFTQFLMGPIRQLAWLNAALAEIGIGNRDESLQRMVGDLDALMDQIRGAGMDLEAAGGQRWFTKRFEEFKRGALEAEPPARQFGGALLDIAEKAAEAEESQKRLEEQTKRFTDTAARVHEEMRTPLEVYLDRMVELQNAVVYGGLTWEDYARAVDAAGESLNRATQSKKNFDAVNVAAVTRGTQDAIAASQKAIANQRRIEDQARIAELGRGHMQSTAAMERLLGSQVNEQRSTNERLGILIQEARGGKVNVKQVDF